MSNPGSIAVAARPGEGTGIEIHPLTPGRLADFMAFFDGEAFSDNPGWSSCYCQCFYEDHSQIRWPERTAVENRACAGRRIIEGRMRGLLAYQAGRVVAWCNAAPRTMLSALDDESIGSPERVGTILCFVVEPRLRGRGVARALLDAACRRFETQGLSTVEANPRPNAKSDAENHFGPIGMYLSAGFAVRRTDDDGSVWVCKELGAR
jgi:GNAT superfamily N-acetyltransferase